MDTTDVELKFILPIVASELAEARRELAEAKRVLDLDDYILGCPHNIEIWVSRTDKHANAKAKFERSQNDYYRILKLLRDIENSCAPPPVVCK